MKFLKDQRGGVVLFIALLSVPFLMAVMVLTFDVGNVVVNKSEVKSKLALALRAAAGQYDEDLLSDPVNPRAVVDEARAEVKFHEYLKKNLNLDHSYNPLEGSFVAGRVEVVYFKVVSDGDLPFTYGYNGYSETVDRSGVVGIIRFPVKSSPFAAVAGQEEKSYMYVHSTVVTELINNI
ncbi:MAG: hypothetical protein JL50_21635 [Peptococcaceae bacterium BICA1-7]|nr:MAG: hypothetical protein JL50_21635 [Peptococcaceae bacterium BICA1-7]HBV99340.1 hypothetical protein [Desulfotomaculum sp.]